MKKLGSKVTTTIITISPDDLLKIDINPRPHGWWVPPQHRKYCPKCKQEERPYHQFL